MIDVTTEERRSDATSAIARATLPETAGASAQGLGIAIGTDPATEGADRLVVTGTEEEEIHAHQEGTETTPDQTDIEVEEIVMIEDIAGPTLTKEGPDRILDATNARTTVLATETNALPTKTDECPRKDDLQLASSLTKDHLAPSPAEDPQETTNEGHLNQTESDTNNSIGGKD